MTILHLDWVMSTDLDHVNSHIWPHPVGHQMFVENHSCIWVKCPPWPHPWHHTYVPFTVRWLWIAAIYRFSNITVVRILNQHKHNCYTHATTKPLTKHTYIYIYKFSEKAVYNNGNLTVRLLLIYTKTEFKVGLYVGITFKESKISLYYYILRKKQHYVL